MLKKIYLLLIIGVFALNCAPTKHYTRDKVINNPFNNTSEKSFNWDNDDDNEILNSITDSNNNFDNYHEIIRNKTVLNNNASTNGKTNLKNAYDSKNKKKQNITGNKTKKENNPNIVSIPQKINNHQFTHYKIKKGDTLTKISKKFSISENEIIKNNNIKNKKIYTGMNLKIPITDTINKSENYSSKNSRPDVNKNKPDFCWPLSDVFATERDGLDGVKPIGIIITGKSRTNVLSSADGVVTKVGHMRGFGNYIILKHVNKYLTIYSFLKEVKVREGENIKKGKMIGCLEGNKLHFQIGHSGKHADPLIYLAKKG